MLNVARRRGRHFYERNEPMRPKLDTNGWPPSWEMLKASDMCRGQFQDVDGSCCMEGWLNKIMSGDPHPYGDCRYQIRDTMRDHIREAAGVLSAKVGRPTEISVFGINDDCKNSLALLARIWNLSGAMAGYVVDNPQAKTLRKLKAKR